MSVVLVFIAVLISIRLIQKYFKLILSGFRIPGPWFVPFVGNIQLVRNIDPKTLFYMIHELRETYQRTFRIWLGPNLWVFLHSSEETREALNEQSLVRADTFQKLSSLIGNGLLLSEGKQWHNHRRALAPAFHPNVLASCTDRIHHHAEIFVERVLEKKEVEVSNYVFCCMLDTICESLMGKNLKTQEENHSAYVHAFHEASELLFQRMSNPLFFVDFIYNLTPYSKRLEKSINIIHRMTEEIINEQVNIVQYLGDRHLEKNKRSLLQILLTEEIDGVPISSKSIQDEVNTFLFAGVDTTAAAFSLILYCLAKYPECQEKLLNEILSDSHDIQDVNKMIYLDMFIKECLGLYTIVPLTGRQVTKDIKIGSTDLVCGTTVWINMYGLAHDPKHFPDPYLFNPERFGCETPEIQPYAFLPFSGGSHSCIGKKYAMLAMKILTVQTILKSKVQLKNPNEELDLMAEMVLKSKNGIHLVFEKRS